DGGIFRRSDAELTKAARRSRFDVASVGPPCRGHAAAGREEDETEPCCERRLLGDHGHVDRSNLRNAFLVARWVLQTFLRNADVRVRGRERRGWQGRGERMSGELPSSSGSVSCPSDARGRWLLPTWRVWITLCPLVFISACDSGPGEGVPEHGTGSAPDAASHASTFPDVTFQMSGHVGANGEILDCVYVRMPADRGKIAVGSAESTFTP